MKYKNVKFFLILLAHVVLFYNCKTTQQRDEIIEDKIHSLALQLHENAVKYKDNRTAVVGFSYSEKTKSEICSLFADKLTIKLVKLGGIRIIDRTSLKKIIDEQKLSESGLIEQKGAAETGKILGARFLITGSLKSVMRQLNVSARMIDSSTGEIISAGDIQIPERQFRQGNRIREEKRVSRFELKFQKSDFDFDRIFKEAKERPLLFLYTTLNKSEYNKLIRKYPIFGDKFTSFKNRLRKETPEKYKKLSALRRQIQIMRKKYPEIDQKFVKKQNQLKNKLFKRFRKKR